MSGWTSGFSGGGRAAYQQLQHGARRVPRGVWATLQVVLLTLLLLAGVLPLWLSTVRRIKRQADDLEVLCGLYPNVNQTVVNNSYLSPSEDPRKPSDLFKVDTIYESVPVAPPPPAPPGAQPVDDAEACYRQFESYFDYEGSRYYNYWDTSAPWGKLAYIKFTITIQDVDPKALTATAQVAMTTSGALRHAGNELMMPEGYLLNIAFNNAPPDVYKRGDDFGANTVKILNDIPMATENDLTFYPFDRYNFDIHVDAYFIDIKHHSTNNNTEDNAKYLYAPFIAGMRTRSPAFSFSVPVGSRYAAVAPGGSTFYYKIQVERNQSTKVFSIFVFIVMWALTIFFVVHAVWVIVYRPNPDIPYDVPAYSATLLFALPAVRAVQPGVPDVGAVIDIVGFFWNMALLALTSCWLLAAIYVRGRARRRQQQEQQDHGGQHHSISMAAVAAEPEVALAWSV